MKYRAVCFDIDGTLYPLSFLKKRVGHLALMHPFVTADYRKLRIELRKKQEEGDLNFDDLSFREKEASVYAALSKTSPDEARRNLDDKYYTYLAKEYSLLSEIPETRNTLLKIHKAGIRIGVFSDWPLFDKLTRIGIENLCDVITNSDTSGFLKPCPRAFDEMISKLGLPVSEILYVGDSYEKDVLGAVRAGMDAVLINPDCRKESDYPKAVKVCRTWKEFDEFATSLLEEE